MGNEDLSGGCNCGAVRYRLKAGARLPMYACHCTDCQTRTGSAFSEHMLVAESDLEVSGPLAEGTLTQHSGAVSTVYGCKRCLARIYATSDRRGSFASLRCGTLDNSAMLTPAAHLWISSMQPWITLPADAPTHQTQPDTDEAWVAFLTGAQ